MTKTITQLTERQQVLIHQLWQEIQLIPQEQWENLLQIMRTFRQATTSNIYSKNITPAGPEHQEQIKKNQAVLELLQKWEEQGDEQEQTETLNYLREALP